MARRGQRMVNCKCDMVYIMRLNILQTLERRELDRSQ